MKSSRTSIIVAIAVVIVLAVAVGARFMVWNGSGHDGVAIGGPFTLVDETGKTVTDADFRGQFMLIYFGYTFCPDVCPTSLGVVGRAMDMLPPDAQQKVTPIFISVDPERDTPALLKDYTDAFHPRMVGLTGSDEQLRPVMKAFKVYAAKAAGGDPKNYTMDHSSILYLMGPDGRFIAHFPHGTTAEDLAAGLKRYLD